MSRRQTDALVAALKEGLAPVRRNPPLRVVFSLTLVVWAMFATAALVFVGLRGELWQVLATNPTFGALLVGLVIAAAGGTLASLASAVPGRERAFGASFGVAAAGLATAVGFAVAIAATLDLDAGPGPGAGAIGMCLRKAALLSVLPAVVLVGFAVRGWVVRPWLAAVSAAFGSVAVGGLIVHLSCPLSEAMHGILGHAAAPVIGAAIAAPLVAAWLRWMPR